MNSKKSKKHRPKTDVPSPQNVEVSGISENLQTGGDEIKSDDKISCDEKDSAHVIAMESVVQATPVLIEENTSLEEPVKPKRKKGKKKKQEEFDDQKETNAEQEPVSQATALLDVPVLDAAVSDTESVTKPKTRKKKNKNKKSVETHDSEVKTEENLTKNLDIETSEARVEVTPSPEPKAKKKNKKKKHHSESENIECTSAFQQILDTSEAEDEVLSPDNNTEAVPENKKEESYDELDTTQPAKSKKKNKKHKKQSHIDDDDYKPQEKCKEKDSRTEEQELIASEKPIEVIEESTPKPKAVIAKPVDKKRRKKNISMSSNDDGSKFDDNKDLIDVQVPISASTEQVDSEKLIHPLEKTKEAVKETYTTTSQHTEDKKDIEDQQNIKNIQQHQTVIINEPELPFTEVRPSRKKKRSSKSTSEQNYGIKPSENVTIQIQKEECIVDTNITPDFIQHPRSSSQQQCDNNNNTIIQEINTPDEVRLGIPFLMSVPVIQGSGESPEVRSQVDPLDIEVTELNINKPTEKESPAFESGIKETPLMEELKQSIEKSLAELTALEKADIEIEKQFLLKGKLDDVPIKITEDIVLIKETENKNDKPILDILPDPISKPVDTPVTEQAETIPETVKQTEMTVETKEKVESCEPPICPSRTDKKGKSKKRGKKSSEQVVSSTTQSNTATTAVATDTSNTTQEKSKDKQKKPENTKEKGKQQTLGNEQDSTQNSNVYEAYYEPIENFEDALTSSTEDVNQTFEMIAKEASERKTSPKPLTKPEISITEPEEDKKPKNENPVSPPKNLLGHPNIPVQSNKADYKKEKDKPPNSMSAKVKIKDSVEVEKPNKNKESKTLENTTKQNSVASNTCRVNEDDEFVYKYSFRKVFLPNICHVCNKDLVQRIPCKFCNLVFYCSKKHKDEDWSKHQSLCFAVCTITHLKDQKFIYGNAKNVTGQDYRLLRMQMIMSGEKMLKRKLVPWEQEALLYPRICSDSGCREWKQILLSDCEGCRQVAFCLDHPEHLPPSHKRWCKSYALYHKLVTEQLSRGRLEPKLPNKMLTKQFEMPEKINEVLAALFEGKADMSDIQYATLTQIASAPLTTAYCYQLSRKHLNGVSKRSTLTIHIVGAELQFEADVLNKWEKFFLHLRPDVKELRVVHIGADLNPSNLPLNLLSRVKLCEPCRKNNRRLLFSFEDRKSYLDYYTSEDFVLPDIVCAFNQSIDRASAYKDKDPWTASLKCISKLKKPFLITSYTMQELKRDVSRILKTASFDVISEAKYNNFASVRPDRNFITDDEIPLLFKNYCFSVVCGA